MSDEETTLAEDSVDTADQTNWEQRFKDTQGAYTKSQQELATERGVWEDEQAALNRLAEKFPHLFEEGEEETSDDEDFDDPRDAEIRSLKEQLGQFGNWQKDVETERGERRFNADLADVAGDRELTDRQRAWIKDRTSVLGNNRDALKKAFEDFSELEKELTGAYLDQVTKSKKTQHTASGGKPGTQVPDLDDQQQRHAYLRQRAAELEAANRR